MVGSGVGAGLEGSGVGAGLEGTGVVGVSVTLEGAPV